MNDCDNQNYCEYYIFSRGYTKDGIEQACAKLFFEETLPKRKLW